MKKVLLISILLFCGAEIFAQSFYSNRINRRWMATGGLGYARSLGDLTNPGSYFDTRLNIVGGLQYRFTNRVQAGVNLMAFQLSGDDQDIDPELNTRSRGLSFVSNNLELSATASVSLFPTANRFTQRKLVNPFVFAGLGVLLFDPRAEVPEFLRDEAGDTIMAVPRAGEMVTLRQYQTERPNTYGRFAMVIPVGVGVRVKVTEFIDITAQVSNRITFTDYLDDVSGVGGDKGRGYPDKNLFDLNNPEDVTALALSDPTGQGEIRGNPESDDYYLIFNVKAEFYIQGDMLNKIFGVGGKHYNIRPNRGRGGLFNFGRRR
jgi:hypothetical protein